MKKELKIALVAIASLVIVFFGLNFLKGISVFADNDSYVMTFDNVAGVQNNCPVYAEGVIVGSVRSIDYDYAHRRPTYLDVVISKMMRIPVGTKAEVKSDLMGNTQINLILAKVRDYMNPGDTIIGCEEEGAVDRLKAMLPQVEMMMPKLDSILTNINIILSDPAIRSILHNTDRTTANLDAATQKLNTLVAGLNKQLPGMMNKADRVLTNSDKLTANLADIDFQGTMKKVDQTLAEVHTTVEKINSPNGTVGKLLNDTQLYDNLSATAADADALMKDLKANPKRYVHFSIFGRKAQ